MKNKLLRNKMDLLH